MMSTDLRIPKLGISMTEATLSEWLVADGATVQAGTPIYAIEMDKSTNEIEAPVGGVLKIIGEIGQTYEVGALIGSID